VQPTVSTRKNVPINSAIYFLILVFGLSSADLGKILYRNEAGRGSYFSAPRILDSVRIQSSAFRDVLATAVTFRA
jgi:hypothetical protein